MYVGSGHFFLVQNFEFPICFWGFQKNKYFFGYEDFVDIFLGLSQNWTIKGSFLCILGSFLKVNVQNGGHFLGLLKFQIFFGLLEIPDIFWG